MELNQKLEAALEKLRNLKVSAYDTSKNVEGLQNHLQHKQNEVQQLQGEVQQTSIKILSINMQIEETDAEIAGIRAAMDDEAQKQEKERKDVSR